MCYTGARAPTVNIRKFCDRASCGNFSWESKRIKAAINSENAICVVELLGSKNEKNPKTRPPPPPNHPYVQIATIRK